ncbi:E3.2.1.14 [Mytilus coruscus]|uniref:E3.2.1.14 n=1 Tax=Mytilus coruscus TaxID=42192 RepID=A0A6J8DPV0_MYTCO|nr:E3.2.1.14 [Mytilus coruscus]
MDKLMVTKWNPQFFILAVLLFASIAQGYKRVCYHTNWAQYRPEPYKFFPDDIDPSLCTHIIYSFGKVVGNTIQPYEWNDQSNAWSVGKYEDAANLKIKNPDLKILLAIGGWTHGSAPFTALVDNTKDMETFADNAIGYLRDINFDGLDLDWEYPANRGSPPEDKQRFTELCRILRKTFENEGNQSGRSRLLLTAAVAAGEETVDSAYDIAAISQGKIDGVWTWENSHNSPLYARSDESTEQKTLNQEYAINLWLNGGTPKEKLIVGMGLYGRSFKMASSSHALGSPAAGGGAAGRYTKEAGFLSFYEVCHNLANGWSRVWNDEQKVPYAYKGDQWVGYDDLQSITVKAEYVKNKGLGGSMVWAMDLDDFTNSCGFGINPLMSKLKELLPTNSVVPTGNPKTQAPSSSKPTESLNTAKPTQTVSTNQPTQSPNTAKPTQKVSTNQPTQSPNTVGPDASSNGYKRVCYHTNWAQYRPEPYKFFPDDIDPSLCTHIIYSFGKVVGNTIQPYEWNDESDEWSVGKYEDAANLKIKNPDLKILLAIGGWTHGSVPFTALVNNTKDMATFADNAIGYLRNINFDGLDLDWEYPANRGSPPEDKQRFTQLCKILRSAFEDEAKKIGRPRLLLTAAVAAGEETIESAYEIGPISKELDFINLMAYDLHGSWEKFLGHNSPLYARSDESTEQKKLNQDYAVNLWLNGGTPKEKLILGLGLYGRSFKMFSSAHALGSPAAGAGTQGPYTREGGFLSFYEVCQNLAKGWTRVWNDEQKVPYAYKGDQWVGYDDLESIQIKADYIRQNGLGGSMIWAIDLDDFRNSCGLGINPLMSKLKEMLPDRTVQPTQATTNVEPTKAPTSSKPTQAPTTVQPTQATTTVEPTKAPTSSKPTQAPTTVQPTKVPATDKPTQASTTAQPTLAPTTVQPTQAPTTAQPTQAPTTAKPTQAPTTAQPTKAPTTQSPGGCGAPVNCENGKYYADACDPKVYYHCGHGIAYTYKCGADTVWDSGKNYCNWDYIVNPTTPDPCAPTDCVEGNMYGDSCDDQSYYICSEGKLSKHTCADGTLWDSSIDKCNWEDDVGAKRCAPVNCESDIYVLRELNGTLPLTTVTGSRNEGLDEKKTQQYIYHKRFLWNIY